ncbi:MAG TPA: hypothetical protein VD794_07465 [Flavisolibacter sp.]|nr:hypothetical protein [Flavisolibacter sp.]
MTLFQEAQQSRNTLLDIVFRYISQNPGSRAADIKRVLGLDSDFEGNQRSYLIFSLLGLLVNDGRVRYETEGRSKLYFPIVS